MTRCVPLGLVLPFLLLWTPPASAVTSVVGDPAGFGISPTEGLVRATPAPHDQPADVDGDGIIEADEYLPDWNANGNTAVGSADSFDFREADELAGSHGEQWTDLSVESSGSADGLTFTFEFDVPQLGDFDYQVGHFINFIFGDYDVSPTNLDIDGETVGLTLQGSGDDGLVQSAFAEVPWDYMVDGIVVITVLAPNEPYLAFDYALLDTARIADSDGDGLPEALDNCPGVPNLDQLDSDEDGVGDVCDLCPETPDPEQLDTDGDGQGDACDPCPGDATDDGDEDGWCAPDDCEPLDPEVHPDAHEVCDDGLDNDCDGTTDVLPDVDEDGWDPCAGDCDEGDPAVHPEAEELCNGVDDDCDGALAEDEVDADGDGELDCVEESGPIDGEGEELGQGGWRAGDCGCRVGARDLGGWGLLSLLGCLGFAGLRRRRSDRAPLS